MRLFLIRHGETPWTITRQYQGTTDVPLSLKGIRQAKRIAKVLAAESPSKLYTSGLKRARVTAKLIGKRLGLRPISDPRLNEIDFGKWEGAHYPLLSETDSREFQRWREGKLRKPPGGESVESLARRVGRFLRDLTRAHLEDTVAIVSHGGPIKMILYKVLGIQRLSIWSLRIDPASISLVEGDPRLFQIVWTNRTDHLLPSS